MQFVKDGNYRRTLARHMGGSNLGFMDGHAKWMPAESVVAGVPPNTTTEPIVENLSLWQDRGGAALDGPSLPRSVHNGAPRRR